MLKAKNCSLLLCRSKHTGKVIAIRREDQSVWERRAALAPTNVRQLVRQGVKVIVQPSNRRAYPVQSYINAGAVIQEDISEASVIFGVKQVPVDLLLPDRTYCMFSHTIKAQESNMPLLDAVIEKNIRLIDYEKLIDEQGRRVVAFGKYAGVAGMVNILHGIGLRLLALGHHTPFMHVGPAHNYRNSSMARQAIRDAGYEIALGMMPKSIGPLTFVFTGSGNVSQGAQEVFQELPHEYVPPEMLSKVANHGATTKVYGCEVRRRHHLERKEGGGYDRFEYEQHPSKYISTFSKKIAPHTSVLINGIYWAVDSPKLLTLPDAKNLLRPAHTPWLPTSEGAPPLPHRMLGICDISADPGGSIEFMNECTTIDTPFCLYDADRNKDFKSFKGPGVLVCSIDNMPTQLPRESTDFFGDLVLPYTFDILQSDATKPLEVHNFNPSVEAAIIASNGKLTPNFQYIQELRNLNQRSRHKYTMAEDDGDQSKNVLVLGAGRVCSPLIEYLNREGQINIKIGSLLRDEMDSMSEKYPRVSSVLIDVEKSSREHLTEVFICHYTKQKMPFKCSILTVEINAGGDLMKSARALDFLPGFALEGFANRDSIRYAELYGIAAEAHTPGAKFRDILPNNLDSFGAKDFVIIQASSNHVSKNEADDVLIALRRSLAALAVEAGVTVVNEIGLDPGIDHLLAMEVIDEVHANGGKVESFVSYCGGLPAPEHSDNPLRYKFSWSPRGVLLNTLGQARFLLNSKTVEINAGGDLMKSARALDFLPGFALEGFANRDSIRYAELYGIAAEAHTVFRGTLRFSGYVRTIQALQKLGLIDPNPHPCLHPKGPEISWREFICSLVGLSHSDIFYENLLSKVSDCVGVDQLAPLEDLGILDDHPVIKYNTPLDTLSFYLSNRLAYGEGERDVVILRHELGIVWPGDRREERGVTLVEYGDISNNITAMARTVGLPAAIAAKMVLDGEIQEHGMVLPFTPDIYRPILSRLRAEGIVSKETIKSL
ncbi:alpha-aminoadipic semialdehyde synthase, mitochondrial [Nilaparvata lugens]|uniref:alpha-aminoadipic semialdehyde synthase, mitochondrial n=1 Tax=Nilaparvata lugens TaxID=108931 RepID=UPI00193D32B1|nr:alpha-aminoadipic semialdehyde synthase, mitochondrial [Nilaparvata lugens]